MPSGRQATGRARRQRSFRLPRLAAAAAPAGSAASSASPRAEAQSLVADRGFRTSQSREARRRRAPGLPGIRMSSTTLKRSRCRRRCSASSSGDCQACARTRTSRPSSNELVLELPGGRERWISGRAATSRSSVRRYHVAYKDFDIAGTSIARTGSEFGSAGSWTSTVTKPVVRAYSMANYPEEQGRRDAERAAIATPPPHTRSRPGRRPAPYVFVACSISRPGDDGDHVRARSASSLRARRMRK